VREHEQVHPSDLEHEEYARAAYRDWQGNFGQWPL
jgi:hypothetical protein